MTTIYYLRWMNRSRYKNKDGKLIIKTSNVDYTKEQEALSKFEMYTEMGYAVQLNACDQREVETIDGRKIYLRSSATNIKENQRWAARIFENEKEKLKKRISAQEAELARMKGKLADMEEQEDFMIDRELGHGRNV